MSVSDPRIDHYLNELDLDVTVLIAASERHYSAWRADAAFYLLRAALDVAETPTSYAAVLDVARRRRDEPADTTPAAHGVFTSQYARWEGARQIDSYAWLVNDVEHILQSEARRG